MEKMISLYEGYQSEIDNLPIIDGQFIFCKDTGNLYKDSNGERDPVSTGVEIVDEKPLAPIYGRVYIIPGKSIQWYDGIWHQIATTSEMTSHVKNQLTEFEKKLHQHDNIEILDKITEAFTTVDKQNLSSAYKHSTSAHAPANAEKNIFNKIKVNGEEVVPNTNREAELKIPKSGGDVEVQDNQTMKVNRVDASSVDGILSETNIPNINANKITGVLSIKNIPKSAMERIIVVKDDTARFALTSAKAQSGDTVKVQSTNQMYYIKDDSKLNTEDGYEPYTASEAASVEWRNVKNHPSGFKGATPSSDGVSGFVPTPSTHDISRFLKGDGTWATPTDTKNTAGATDSSNKLFLIGATAQSANPQTYSHDTAYIGTDGCLYSDGKKVLTEHDGNNRRSFFGICETAGNVANKVITLNNADGWELVAGTIVGIRFKNSNSATNVTFNVNESGEKSVYVNTSVYKGSSVNYCGYANRTLYYIYDGTYWSWINMGVTNDNTIPSVYCSTASATASKAGNCTGYNLLKDSYIHVLTTKDNTAKSALTLNINNKGAKPIYINGLPSSATNYTLPSGTYLVYYNGTNYYFRTDGKLTTAGIVDINGNTDKYYKGDGTLSDIDANNIKNLSKVAKSGSYNDLSDAPKPYDDTSLKADFNKKINQINNKLNQPLGIPIFINGQRADNISFIWNGKDDFSIFIPGAIDRNDNFITWSEVMQGRSYDPNHFGGLIDFSNYEKVIMSDDITCIEELPILGKGILSLPNFVKRLNMIRSENYEIITIPELPKTVEYIDVCTQDFFIHCVDTIHINEGNEIFKEDESHSGTCFISKSNGHLLFTTHGATSIPSEVTIMENACFNGSPITKIVIPSKVTTISGVNRCSDLLNIVFNETGANGEKQIINAFNECNSLTEINIDCNAVLIEDSFCCNSSAFNRSSIETINLPQSLREIKGKSFSGLENLKEITIPSGVTNIDSKCFSNCPNLKTIHYNGNATGAPWGATNATVVA